MIRALHSILIHSIALVVGGLAVASPPDLELQKELLRVVNDRDAAAEERIRAEHRLREIADARFIPYVFANIGEPIQNEFGHLVTTPQAYASIPGGGSPEADAKVLPVSAQIAYARLRIWDAVTRHGQPEDLRAKILVDLFDGEYSDFQLRQLIVGALNRNLTEQIRHRLLRVATDRDGGQWERVYAARALLDSRSSTPAEEFIDIRSQLIDAAWAERMSHFSRDMTTRIRDRSDPRVAILHIDRYEWKKQQAEMRRQPLFVGHVEVIGVYFNILRDSSRRAMTREEQEEVIRLGRLRRLARQTGDDTELRKLEQAIEQRKRHELESRINIVDAWIADNRERLEREAEEFVRQREREREQQ